MKRILSYCLIGVMMLSGAFWGCSDKKEPALEKKSAIKKMTEETAREAVNQIRTPIDKARSAAQQQQDKAKEMDDALKKQ
jgi:PBP1b-binding outer membrane lipoprotein LpoB